MQLSKLPALRVGTFPSSGSAAQLQGLSTGRLMLHPAPPTSTTIPGKMERGKVLCGSYRAAICYSSRTENTIKSLLPPAFHTLSIYPLILVFCALLQYFGVRQNNTKRENSRACYFPFSQVKQPLQACLL